MSVHILESTDHSVSGVSARFTACHRTIINPEVKMVEREWIVSGARRTEVTCARCRARYGLKALVATEEP